MKKIVLAGLILLTSSRIFADETPPYIEDTDFLLNTIVSIRLYGSQDKEHLDEAFQIIKDSEALLSRHQEGSDISRINSAPASTAVQVSPETIKLIQEAVKYAELSSGTFDPTVGPLVDLWGIGTDHARVPAREELQSALNLIDYRNIHVDEENGTVALEAPNMSLDLGGITKGWIADKVAAALHRLGEDHFIINLGGNILVSGGKPDGRVFRVGMQNPSKPTGQYIGIFDVSDASIVSSGVYERFFEQDGVRYHHILSTEDGYPINNGLTAVTVITDKSVDGDALSTTLFTLGLEGGAEMAQNLDGVEAAFITDDGKLYMTEGAAAIYTPTARGYRVHILGRRFFNWL